MSKNLNHLLTFGALLSGAFLIAGCSESFEKTEMIPIDKVPEQVLSVAKEKLPGVKFDSAWSEKEGGKVFYEVRGKSADGKTRDIKVSSDGKVMEID